MLKVPRPGRVKTRLGRDIGHVTAAWWYRHQVARLLRRIDDPRWRVVLCVAPDVAGLTCRFWPARYPRLAQGGGDLGDRMARALAAMPPGDVILIGSDIPAISPAHIARAFRQVARADAVFGPARDGGYWLIGMRNGRVPKGAFGGVRWSGPHALGDSIASLGGARVLLADTLDDVDCQADLLRQG